MKYLVLSVFLCFSLIAWAQPNVVFEDQKLKDYFLRIGIDDNLDDEIDSVEALDAIYITLDWEDSVAVISNLEPFQNLLQITYSSNGWLERAEIKNLPNLQYVNLDGHSSFNKAEFENLPDLSRLETGNYLRTLTIKDAPLLDSVVISEYLVDTVVLVNTPLYDNYDFYNLHYGRFENVGTPKNNLIRLGFDTGPIPETTWYSIKNVNNLKKIQTNFIENTTLKIENNDSLTFVKLFQIGTDTIDLSSNPNIDTIQWGWDNQRGFVPDYDTGAVYMNIKGLSKLKQFYKTSDHSVYHLDFDTMPNLKEGVFAGVYHHEYNTDMFLNIEILQIGVNTDRLVAIDVPSLTKLGRVDISGGIELECDYIDIRNCENLNDLNFYYGYKTDTLIAHNLPVHGNGVSTLTLKDNAGTNSENLKYLSLKSINNLTEVLFRDDLSNDIASQLKYVYIDSLDFTDSLFLANAENLETVEIHNTKLEELYLKTHSKLVSIDVTNNEDLQRVCLYDLNPTVSNPNYQKDAQTEWRNHVCGTGFIGIDNLERFENFVIQNGFLVIKDPTIKDIMIYDVNGKLEFSSSINNANIIDLSNLSPGIYLVKVSGEISGVEKIALF